MIDFGEDEIVLPETVKEHKAFLKKARKAFARGEIYSPHYGWPPVVKWKNR